MEEVKANVQNLDAHYTTEAKVKRHPHVVVSAPEALPTYHVYNDIDANKRLADLNNDIYVRYKEEKAQPKRTFLKAFGAIVATILAIVGIKRIFK